MLEIGQTLHEKYRIDRVVGKGGMGQVFEGFHLLIGRRVAIKILLPEVAASEAGNARFAAEARAAASINNPHILDVLDAGALPDGSRFMVSEFLDGEPLEARLSRGRLTAEETAVITLQLLDGLAAAHRAGITHRDLKPDNIFLSRKAARHDFVKIIDFGISKFAPNADEAMRMTTTGVVLGTPQYFSPEQARGERVDPRSDLYSVGAIMYRCVAGYVPFAADTVHALLFRIALQNAPPLAAIVRGLDPGFSELTQKAMAKQPEARFQSAEEMSHALKVWLDRSHRGAEARADRMKLAAELDATTTAGPVPLPTSDSFELAGMTPPFVGQTRKRATAIVLALGVGVLLVGATLLTLRRPSSSAPATLEHSPSRASAPAAPATQNTPASDLPPAPSPQSTPADDARPDALMAPKSSAADKASAIPRTPSTQTPALTAPSRKPTQRRSHPSEAQRPSSSTVSPPTTASPPTTVSPPTTASPAPKPSATTRPRRDFGY